MSEAPKSPNLYTTWARHTWVDITFDHLERQTAARWQFFCEQLGVFLVPFFIFCDYFGLANRLEVCFVDFFARGLFATQSPFANLVVMDVDEL